MTASGVAPRQIVHMQPTSNLPERKEGHTRFVLLSDTHAHTFKVPPGDILLHAGDLTVFQLMRFCIVLSDEANSMHQEYGEPRELQKTVNWLASLPHKHKIMIAGNVSLRCCIQVYTH